MGKSEVILQCLSKLKTLEIKDYSYYNFTRIVNEILADLNFQRSISESDEEREKLFNVYRNVDITLHQEGEFIHIAEKELQKKDSKIKRAEHKELISRAINCIEFDLISL